MKHLFLAVFFLLGCVTPSTVLVNRDGRMLRCATQAGGFGLMGSIAIATAQSAHDRCVEDARLVGFVPIPRAQLGVRTDIKQNPMPITELGENAKNSGLAIGDLLLELDGKATTNLTDLMAFLNSKAPGDVVEVKIRRGTETNVYKITLQARGAP